MRMAGPIRSFRTAVEKNLPAALCFFALLSVLLPSLAEAGATEGKKVFNDKKCVSCHQVEGPAMEKTIKDVLAKKGPELWYSGSKFKAGFLEGWLRDPKPIRPMKYYSITEKNQGDHPRLTAAEARDVAGYLMGLKSPAVKPAGIKPAGATPGGGRVV